MTHLPSVVIEIARLSVWLLVLVVIFVPLERIFSVQPQKIFRKGIGVDLAYYFISGLVPAVLLAFPVSALAWLAHRYVPGFMLEAAGSLAPWARIVAGLILVDVGYYWGHRWCHEVPFLWRFHAVHHSAEEMDFLVSSRAHPFDMVFGHFCGLVPLYVLGLAGPAREQGGSDVALAVKVIGIFWGFLIHANLNWRFGPFEWLIATPAFHHWHHTRTGPIDRNYCATWPWIDWMFGTLYLPNKWPADYGIKGPMSDSLVDQLMNPIFPPAAATTSVSVSVSDSAAPVAAAESHSNEPDAVSRVD
jgi:hypothetical protein